MIEGRIEGEQRQREAVLPPRLPMTTSSVAATDGEDGLDVGLEQEPVGSGLPSTSTNRPLPNARATMSTLVLGGANSYAGTTTVSVGTLEP
jgi:autotransporter-associated beta strand protein